MATRKHFEAIAKVLNNEGVSGQGCSDIADVLESLNPKFDRDRFIDKACIHKEPNWDALDQNAKRDCSLGEAVFSPFFK